MTDLEKAARQALKKLELLHPLTCHDTITALRRALEQQPADEPEAIPVGYWHQGTGAFFKGAYLTQAQEQMRESGVLKPLYTRPQPAAQWVGLTQDEAHTIVGNVANIGDALRIVRDTQAKLREKNGGKASPLTPEQIADAIDLDNLTASEMAAFYAGIRWAEQQHGIRSE